VTSRVDIERFDARALKPLVVGYRIKMHISRHYRDDHIKADNIETAISIYEDQVRGWFFDHATTLEKESDHAGLVTLLIVLSYIEGHAIFYRGEDSNNKSRKFFREAFIAVFGLSDNPMKDAAVNQLYDQMRCGLFHTGMTREQVRISNGYALPVRVLMSSADKGWGVIEINPRLMLKAAEDHLSHYLMRLRDDKNTSLRDNFMKAWHMRGN
jgi:hypothetical protein